MVFSNLKAFEISTQLEPDNCDHIKRLPLHNLVKVFSLVLFWLFGCCLDKVMLQLCYSYVVVWSWFSCCFVVALLLFGYGFVAVWLLFCCCLVAVWMLFCCCSVFVWFSCGLVAV